MITQQRKATNFNFCKAKGQKGSSDSVESIYQVKVDDSLHSNVKDKEGVCYFLKSRLPTAQGTESCSPVILVVLGWL